MSVQTVRQEPPATGAIAMQPGERRTESQLNVRLIVVTALVLAVLGLALYGWHRYQLGKLGGGLLERAQALEKEGTLDLAASYLHRYLQLHPEDVAVRIRMAETYDQSSGDNWQRKDRAVQLYYEVLGWVAGDDQPAAIQTRQAPLRQRLCELLLELGDDSRLTSLRRSNYYISARSEAEKLRELVGHEQQAVRLLALADYGRFVAAQGSAGDQGQAGATDAGPPQSLSTAVAEALLANPGDIRLSVALASLCRAHPAVVIYRQDADALLSGNSALSVTDEERSSAPERADRVMREQLADTVIDRMVAAHPQSSEALLARYAYRRNYRLAGAVEDLQTALEQAPQNPEVLLMAAAQAEAEPVSLAEPAEHYYRRAIDAAPTFVPAYLGMGNLQISRGELDQAIDTWRAGLKYGNPGRFTSRYEFDLNLRLADALVTAGRLDELRRDPDAGGAVSAGPLDVLRDRLAVWGPQLPQAEQLRLERPVDYVEARWLVAKGRHIEALPLLERAAATSISTPEDREQACLVSLLLGLVLEKLNQPDAAALAYERAGKWSPADETPRARAGAAWLDAGQVDRAIENLEAAISREPRAESRLLLAQARFRAQLSREPDQRDWQPFAAALEAVRGQMGELAEPWRVALLEANFVALGGRRPAADRPPQAEAVDLLKQAEADHSANQDLWLNLVLLYEQLGRAADADRALARYGELATDPVRHCLVHSSLLMRRQQLDRAREVLEGAIKTLSRPARFPLQVRLADVELAAGRTRQAKALLEDLERRNPEDLGIVMRLADLSLEARDLEDARRWEDLLRQREGSRGSLWKYYRGRRLLIAVASKKEEPDAPNLLETERLSQDLLRQRPAWSRAHLLSGILREVQGRLSEAVKAYGQALRCGANDLMIHERLVKLLYGLEQFEGAEQHLALLRQRSSQREDLLSWESSLAAGRAATTSDPVQRQQQLERALALAAKACDDRPEDTTGWLWLGQLQIIASQLAEPESRSEWEDKVEETLRRAMELAPGDTRSYSVLFGFYRRTGRTEEAQEVLKQLAEKANLSAPRRDLALGFGYEVLGDLKQAEQQYRQACQLDPGDLAAWQRLAAVLIRTDPVEAETVLREIQQRFPSDQYAKRALAVVLASRAVAATDEDQELWAEVEQLLGQTGIEQIDTVLDRRLYAVVLYRRGAREWQSQAREILMDLVQNPETATEFDRQFLAQLHDNEARRLQAEGHPKAAAEHLAQADEQYQALIRTGRDRARIILSYTQFLLRNGRRQEVPPWCARFEEAARTNTPLWTAFVQLLLRYDMLSDAAAPLARLESLSPHAPTIVELRARWLKAQGKQSEAEALAGELAAQLLREAAEDPKREAAAALTAGRLYAAIEANEEAHRYYRQALAIQPDAYPALAISLAGQGQMSEALGLCRKAAESDTSHRPAIVAAEVLMRGTPSPAEFQQVEEMLTQALESHPTNTGLLMSMANVMHLQGRVTEAITQYRSALPLAPKDMILLNNLATLLAEQQGGVSEALEHIDRAIELNGPRAALLDTKGTILIHAGRADEAVSYLETAVEGPRPDPRSVLHLAVAYARVGRLDDARLRLTAARADDLNSQVLTEKDRRFLAELEGRLAEGPSDAASSAAVGSLPTAEDRL